MYPINIVQFTCLARENFGMFKELCGEKSLKNVVIVTNMWPEKQTEKDKCTRRVERLCAEEELFGLDMADKARVRSHIEQTAGSAHAIIQTILDTHPIPLAIQEELVDQHKSIDETAAGKELDRQVISLVAQLEEKIKLQLGNADAARKRDDEQTKKELLALKKSAAVHKRNGLINIELPMRLAWQMISLRKGSGINAT